MRVVSYRGTKSSPDIDPESECLAKRIWKTKNRPKLNWSVISPTVTFGMQTIKPIICDNQNENNRSDYQAQR